MNYAESEEDISNVEAWAEIVEDLLYLVPVKDRMKVLDIARTKEEAAIAERAEHGGFTVWTFNADDNSQALRNWNVIMRLKSLIIQVFTRNITNNHSPENAAKLLFAEHPYETGGCCLSDYIDDLPRKP
jgi:hypothetical protein